ncbi:hypothetical protein D3C87_2026210 [compost metagenome]
MAVLVVLVAHAACAAGLFRRKLVGRAFFVRGTAAFGCDFTLALRIHRRETAVAGVAALLAGLRAALFAALVACLRAFVLILALIG